MKKRQINTGFSERAMISVLLTIFFMSGSGQTSTSWIGNNGNAGAGIGPLDNTAFGYDVLWTSTGLSNTGAGTGALSSNVLGEKNTALGGEALYFNSNGGENTACGYQSLWRNNVSASGGSGNTAVGHSALYTNDDGDYNTASGFYALKLSVVGSNNTADGWGALYNSSGSGSTYARDNTAIGVSALVLNTVGAENTAVGFEALYTNYDDNYNTAIGAFAQYRPGNSTTSPNQAYSNTSAGVRALYGLSAAYSPSYSNTACGYSALDAGANNNFNTAGGYLSAQSLYDGYSNTCLGSSSYRLSQSGGKNIAIGDNAMKDWTDIVDGYNVAVGSSAYVTNSSGINNVAVGFGALAYTANDDNNTMIGYRADMNGAYHNASAFGTNATAHSHNMIRIGDANITNIDCAVNYVGGSDKRVKFNIRDKEVKGIEFINALKPVTYEFDNKKLETFICRNMPEEEIQKRLNRSFPDPAKQRQTGLIAQEMEEAIKLTGFEFNGLRKPTNENDYYGIGYGLLVVPLVKAVQEQEELINRAKERNDQLLIEVNSVEKKIAEMRARFAIDDNNGMVISQMFHSPHEITLQYEVLNTVKSASLKVYDLKGTEILSIMIIEKGKGSLKVDSGKIKSGVYLVAVLTDGELSKPYTILVTN